MKQKSIALTFLAALLGLAAYWYWSPFVAMANLKSAIKKNDAQAFNQHVDYPLLRENMKVQFLRVVETKVPKSEGPMGAVGQNFAKAMMVKIVDAMVQPENVMKAMSQGQFADPKKASPATGQPENGSQAPAVKVQWEFERVNADKMIAVARDAREPTGPNAMRLVFERSGFADWKLTGINLPDPT